MGLGFKTKLLSNVYVILSPRDKQSNFDRRRQNWLKKSEQLVLTKTFNKLKVKMLRLVNPNKLKLTIT
jgi:hypothetical protein